MPREKNTLLRVAVPLAVLGLGLLVAGAVFVTSKRSAPAPSPTPSATTTTTTSPTPATGPGSGLASGPASGQASSPPSSPPSTPGLASPAASAPTGEGQAAATAPVPAPVTATAPSEVDWATLRAVVAQGPGSDPTTWSLLGSIDPADPSWVQVEFSPAGAGVRALRLNREYTSIKEDAVVVLQGEVAARAGMNVPTMVPFAAMGVRVAPVVSAGTAGSGGAFVNLFATTAGPVWRQVEVGGVAQPGHFEALVTDGAGTPVLRIVRRFELGGGRGDLKLTQRIENLTGSALSVQWFQTGMVDLPSDAQIDRTGKPVYAYGGDKRRVRFGYLLNPVADPSRSVVVSSDFLIPRATALGSRETAVLNPDGSPSGLKTFEPEVAAWPNAVSTKNGYELVWAGMTNRYYGVSVHALADPNAVGSAKTLGWVAGMTRIVDDPGLYRETMALRIDGTPMAIQPGQTADVSLGLYAGPLDRRMIKADPVHASLGLVGMVVYNFGGPCAFCTFGWMSALLLWLLHSLHDWIFFDWALAIIFLVVIVRGCLHPVTRWSQIRIARFGKQMGAMAPKQKELQEKYKDDPKKLQAETAKLWREEGINPTGMLGCIPMFLQMPVWIALYAVLYFAYELRHQGAFYGLFQSIQPLTSPFWRFLGDLAEPDRFYYFGQYFNVPLLSGLLGPIHSVNILPLILAFVFYAQQKYLQPPTGVPLTPEQQMQQNIVKWMMVVMFPLFMYNAPAGLSLYFIANSLLGIAESKWIRAHMDKHGLLDLDKMKDEARKKREAKGGEGFLERIQRIAEEQQRLRTSPMDRTNPGAKGGRGPGQGKR